MDIIKDIPQMAFNVDAFTKNSADESGNENVRQLSIFLNEIVLSQLVLYFN
jgi:hypothetical protein